MSNQTQTSFSKKDLEELKKKYPNMGKKWSTQDDEKLKNYYTQRRDIGFNDFENFILNLCTEFGRAAGGIKARLAMFFSDVPGWDYEREKNREEELDKKVGEIIKPEWDEMLNREYKKYSTQKRETYLGFLKRLSESLGGVEGRYVSHRLKQLNGGSIEKFSRDEIGPVFGLAKVKNNPNQNSEIPKLNLENNPEALKVLNILENTTKNLFLTGEAGTGKSTLLNYFRKTTKKNVVVLAPTGVAALNIEGQTIHSFCGFKIDITPSKVKKLMPGMPKFKLLQKMNTIIIDEISMVRADLLDCMDKFLRLNGPVKNEAFGGIQMVFIGDLYQLPPVEKDFNLNQGFLNEYQSPYFFDSHSFQNSNFEYISLKIIYRQKDQVFKDVLNAVRNNSATQEHIKILNQRASDPNKKFTFEKFAIYLTPHNAQAKRVNNFFLEKISQELKTYKGVAKGSFEEKEPPTDLELQIKIGAQIMMLNNDSRKRWVNGTMGKIIGIEKATTTQQKDSNSEFENSTSQEKAKFDLIIIELENGETVYVEPFTWEIIKFALDNKTQTIESQATGTFTQYPFKLAWAVTIHKAQGKTFDKVYIDLSTGTFAHGQLYVALSRCRSLEGLFLKRPITQTDIILDDRVVNFMNNFTNNPINKYIYIPEQ